MNKKSNTGKNIAIGIGAALVGFIGGWLMSKN